MTNKNVWPKCGSSFYFLMKLVSECLHSGVNIPVPPEFPCWAPKPACGGEWVEVGLLGRDLGWELPAPPPRGASTLTQPAPRPWTPWLQIHSFPFLLLTSCLGSRDSSWRHQLLQTPGSRSPLHSSNSSAEGQRAGSGAKEGVDHVTAISRDPEAGEEHGPLQVTHSSAGSDSRDKSSGCSTNAHT